MYTVEAKENGANQPLTKLTVALVKENYKLIHYRGYEGYDNVSELYDLKNDPEEMEDLFDSKPSVGKELLDELETKLKEVNQPFVR